MKRLRLRYAAICAMCAAALPKGTEAVWDREAKKAVCLSCLGGDVPAGIKGEAAGASALAQAEAIERRIVDRTRKEWGDDAAAVAAKLVEDDPSVRAWNKGGAGESALAAYIKDELGDLVIGLHDRAIPGRRANIDHIFVAPSGVWIVDSKAYKGKLEKRDVGPLWRQENHVYVNGRDRSSLVEGMDLQLRAVRAALEPDAAHGQIPIHAVICFLGAEWGLFARPFEVRGVTILYRAALRDRLKKDGVLSRAAMERVANRLARSLPAKRAA